MREKENASEKDDQTIVENPICFYTFSEISTWHGSMIVCAVPTTSNPRDASLLPPFSDLNLIFICTLEKGCITHLSTKIVEESSNGGKSATVGAFVVVTGMVPFLADPGLAVAPRERIKGRKRKKE